MLLKEKKIPSWTKGEVSTYIIGGESKGLSFQDPKGTRKYEMTDQEWNEWKDMNTKTKERVAKRYFQKSKLDTRKPSGLNEYLEQGGRVWD